MYYLKNLIELFVLRIKNFVRITGILDYKYSNYFVESSFARVEFLAFKNQ